jgi:hypothetical protein
MRRLVVLALFVLVALAPADRARAGEPDPFKLLLYSLLDFDQRDLFEAEGHSPLAELQSWMHLYVELRDKARNDTSRFLKSFLLMGWIARVKSQFATAEAFNTDFMAQFEAQPEDTLKVMAEQEFLLPELCRYLARFFFFERHDPAGRQPWVDRYFRRMNAVLGPENTSRCLDAFWRAGR